MKTQQSEEQLRYLNDNLLNTMLYQLRIESNGHRRFTYLSEGVHGLHGCSPAQAMADSAHIYGRVLEEDRQRLQQEEELAMASLTTFETELRMQGLDGQIRWSRLVSRPRKVEDGAVLWDGVEIDISDYKRRESALRESEEKFSKAFHSSPVGMTLSTKQDGRYLDINAAFLELLQRSREEVIGRTAVELGVWADSDQRASFLTKLCAEGRQHNIEVRWHTKSGLVRDVVMSGDEVVIGGIDCLLGTVLDITERKNAERQVLQLNRIYTVLSEINETIVREKDSNAMLAAACQIAVEKGKFRMAWVALLDDATQRLEPVASAGFGEGYTDVMQIDLRNESRRKGPGASCLFSGERVVCNDTERDPYFAPWRDEAMRRGYRASGSFPLKVAGKTVGVFSLYTETAHFFDEQQLLLLDELALDLGYALEISNREAARYRLEQELQASEERYKIIFENAPDAVLLIAADGDDIGRILAANKIAAQMHGYMPGELVGKRIEDLNKIETPEQRLERFQRIASGELSTFELEHRQKDGSIFPVEVVANRIVAGGRACVLDFERDLTTRKIAAAALQRQESRLASYFRTSPVGLCTARDRVLLEVNDRMCELSGYTRDELLGHSSSMLYPDANESERVARKLYGLVEAKLIAPIESRWRRKDGTLCDVLIQASWLDPANPATGITGAITDITERKRIEESHAKLAMVVDQAAETIVITDTKGTILYTNPAFEKTTGYPCAEAVGQNPRVLKSGKQSDKFYRSMWETLERGEVWHGHFINRHKKGTLYEEEATISPVRDGAGKIISYVAVKRDVTREVQLEKQFLEAQKMESVGQLAGGVAHDFNNILAATIMHLSLLQQNKDLMPEIQETINELIEGAERGAGLVRQLLMFSRRSVMEVKLLDLNEVVTNLLKMLGRLIGEHIVVRFGRREGLPALEADAGMIEQVIMNLAVNARDAMPDGGEINIGIETLVVDEERIKWKPDVQPGQFLCLSVGDTGCGIDEITCQRIFEPFFTTKAPGKGTGLGLATVHGIVAQHRGWVEVESEVGQGTTFKVFLPASTKEMAEVAPAARAAIAGGHETILVVEDEESVRRVVALNLRRLGYAVFEVENGQAAINLWQQRNGEFDLLFSDMVMPEGLTGLDLSKKLKKENSNLKVIISSGYSAETAGQSALAGHGIIYLQKPYRIETLAKVVRQCLDGNGCAMG